MRKRCVSSGTTSFAAGSPRHGPGSTASRRIIHRKKRLSLLHALPSSGEESSDGQGRGAKARRLCTKLPRAGSTVSSPGPSPARNSRSSEPWRAAARFTADEQRGELGARGEPVTETVEPALEVALRRGGEERPRRRSEHRQRLPDAREDLRDPAVGEAGGDEADDLLVGGIGVRVEGLERVGVHEAAAVPGPVEGLEAAAEVPVAERPRSGRALRRRGWRGTRRSSPRARRARRAGPARARRPRPGHARRTRRSRASLRRAAARPGSSPSPCRAGPSRGGRRSPPGRARTPRSPCPRRGCCPSPAGGHAGRRGSSCRRGGPRGPGGPRRWRGAPRRRPRSRRSSRRAGS